MATDPAVQAAAEAIAGCASDEFAEMDRPQRVWYLNLADAALKAAAPLIRAQAFTEAADTVKAECAHGDMHWGNFDPDRCPICSHFIAAVRGLGEETASVDSKINTT